METPSNTEPSPPLTARARYNELEIVRKPYLERARDNAKMTIPQLLPPEGYSGATKLYQPFQSTGAEGVNNLSAKLLLTLFQPDFFRLDLDEFVVEEMQKQASGKDLKAEFDKALAKMERAVVSLMETSGARTVNFEALQHVIVAGNGLVQVLDEGNEKFFPLSSYVVKRDLSGNLLEIVTKELLARNTLPPEVREVWEEQAKDTGDGALQSEAKSVELYTWVRREANGSWTIHQEVGNKKVPETSGDYPKGKCPFVALRWRSAAGEDYGRSHCDEYSGDLLSLESLTQSIVEFSAAASKVNPMVDPSGTTDAKEWADAPSGRVVKGRAGDITYSGLQAKVTDFQVTKQVADGIQQRLERAFLMASSVQRNAERVTAEEIRAMVGELEQSLGGVYSILSEEFQKPLVVVWMHQLTRAGKIPALPKDGISPKIVTGIDGLGRNADLQRLDTFIAGAVQVLGQEAVDSYLNGGAYLTRRATALGIDVAGLIRSEAEVQQSRQQKQSAALAEKAIAPGIKAVSDQMQQGQPQPTQQ